MKKQIAFFFAVLVLLPIALLSAEPLQPETARLDRLVSLAKVWAAVKYFHPYLAYRANIDWDRAGAEAISSVSTAATPESYREAVQTMLATLGDPTTSIEPESTSVPSDGAEASSDPSFRTTPEGVLLVSMSHFGAELDFNAVVDRASRLKEEIPNAKAIVFDLRAPARVTENLRGIGPFAFDFARLGNGLTSSFVAGPAERRRMHVGFVPEAGGTSGGYESGFQVAQWLALRPDEGAHDIPTVFLANEFSELPGAAVALQAAGKAAIVAEGNITEASLVTVVRFDMADSVVADIRLGELMQADGTTGFSADLTVPPSVQPGDQDQALQAAISFAQSPRQTPTDRRPLAVGTPAPIENPSMDASYPPPEYRVFAAFKIWAVINYFFPYRDLIGEDWDGVLREFIPRMETAADALEYNLAVKEMVTRFHDGHGFMDSSVWQEYIGNGAAPVRVRMIEGVPVITAFIDDKRARKAGAEIGDVILEVDGEDVATRLARIVRTVSASTTQALDYGAARRLLYGPPGSTMRVTVRDTKDRVKVLELPRLENSTMAEATERVGPPYRALSSDIGYADLDRLDVEMVDAMFEAFKETKAIIFDGRTYPRGTAWAIAPRLTDAKSPVAAKFTRRVAMSPDAPLGEIDHQFTTQTFDQRIPSTDKWRYHGKTVYLIDERTQSQAEHTGLFFEAANGTTFIGSPTSGANGDVTNFYLPGGITVHFGGQGVTHADGRQLQRLGLLPEVDSRPTIRGVREGRDEVLEAAVHYLEERRDASP